MNTYFNTIIGFGTGLPGMPGMPALHMPTAQEEINAVRVALEIGYTVFDTAEKYRDGRSELWLGKALQESKSDRSKLHIVSKVLPSNASTKEQVIRSCKNSLARVQCDYFDTYLLHWRQPITMPLEPVIEGLLELKSMGLIKNYGTSNFNRVGGLLEWQRIEQTLSAERMKVNQIHYSLFRKEAEGLFDLHKNLGITSMAHSVINPIRNDNKLNSNKYLQIAHTHGYDPSQLAIAWVTKKANMLTLTRSTKAERILSNWNAQFIELTQEVLTDLESL